MEKYIERSILSIINQSFQNFEIIIVNDFSEDNTFNILKKLQKEDSRIKIISHTQNTGVYASRIEAILLSKSKYIILMDPNDLFLNENLFQELYDYNSNKNIDIIEFSVYHQNEETQIIYNPYGHRNTHFHKFEKNIIYQPELSEILFYIPQTKEYSHIICRNIRNKLIRKEVFIDMIEYIGYNYYRDHFVITADDILMNVISYHFAHNYSNINIPGYLYTIRKSSMSSGEEGQKLEITRSINYLLLLKNLIKTEIFYFLN
jgi:glycosyltransferase involved in cell wall biosynthesis